MKHHPLRALRASRYLITALATAAACAALSVVGSAQAAPCVTPPADLVGWFPGDGDASDLRGGPDGVFMGDAKTSVNGKVGGAFLFDGNFDSVEIPDSAALKPAKLTVDAWVKFATLNTTTIGAPAGHQWLVSKRNSRTPGSGFEEAYALAKNRIGGNDVFVFVLYNAAGASVELASAAPIQAGQFYHVAGTYNGTTARLYVNGV